MCGITGVIAFTEKDGSAFSKVKDSYDKISSGGSLAEAYAHEDIAIGHRIDRISTGGKMI
jgi:hypothetical protein